MKRTYLLILIFILFLNGNVTTGNNCYGFGHVSSPNGDSLHFLNRMPTGTSSFLPVSIAFVSFIYLINPIIIVEKKNLSMGFTKELSLGFGKFGEHRVSIEYSFIFRNDHLHLFRAGYKYDILMKGNLEPSNMLQATSVLALGAGYYTDLEVSGVYPELTYGYSIRNNKFLIFPHAKVRYTFTESRGSNLFDFSFGLMIGLANPFIDLKIRKR